MATPFSVLPQYQGNLYQLQRQQQLAQALTQGALQGQQLPATVGSGQYQVAPRASIGAGISQLGQALLASRLGNQAGQGLGQLGAQQWAALTGQGLGAMSNANAGGFGTSAGAQSPLQSAPAGQSGVGTDAAAGADGATDNVGASAQQPQGMLSPGGPMNPIGMPVQQAAMMYLSNPDKYWEAQAGAYKPTDTSLMLRQAGIDPTSALGRQIMQQAIAKQNYIAPTSLRPGGYAVYADGREEQLPQIPEGFTAQRGPNGWQVVPVQGGAAAMSASAAAKAGGKAQYELKEVWDPTANNGQGGFVQQSVANVANAANGSGGAPAGIPTGGLAGIFAQQESSGGKTSPNNPFQIQQGTFNQFAQPGESWNNVADRNTVAQRMLTKFNQQYGGDLGRIAVAYFSGEGNVAPPGSPTPFLRNVSDSSGKTVASYVGDILGRSGALGSPQTGPMASQPPLGQTQAANASQAAPSKQMADAYSALSAADGNYQASRAALQTMLDITNRDAPGDTVARMLPQDFATKVSNNAAEYEKAHSNFISLQGKALGAAGTDASRANQAASVPDFTKPQQARVEGLNAQLQQLDMNHLKAQFLTPIYQQGNEKTFTAQSAAFDQNIKPSMMPKLQTLMSMTPGADRGAALKAAAQDPSMKDALDLLSGMFK